MTPDESRERAEKLMNEALREQQDGRYESAARLYRASIVEHPTAEAHTYLGWAYSFMGKIDEAIEECRRAIQLDPGFGNPYNDIGSYLMKLGRLTEAIDWLEKAKNAPRYLPRHYPYLNLARLYVRLGRFEEASREFTQARFIQQTLFQSDTAAGSGSIESVN